MIIRHLFTPYSNEHNIYVFDFWVLSWGHGYVVMPYLLIAPRGVFDNPGRGLFIQRSEARIHRRETPL